MHARVGDTQFETVFLFKKELRHHLILLLIRK